MSIPVRISSSKKSSGYSDDPFWETLDSRNASMRRSPRESSPPRRRSGSSGERITFGRRDDYLRRSNTQSNLSALFPRSSRSPVRSTTARYESPPRRRDPFRDYARCDNELFRPRSTSGERPDPRDLSPPNRDRDLRLGPTYRSMSYDQVKEERHRLRRERGYGDYTRMNQLADLERRMNNVQIRDFAYSPKRKSPSGSGRR